MSVSSSSLGTMGGGEGEGKGGGSRMSMRKDRSCLVIYVTYLMKAAVSMARLSMYSGKSASRPPSCMRL